MKKQEFKSKSERRKKLDPRKWANKWLRNSPIPIFGGMSEIFRIQEDNWKYGISCHTCQSIFGVAYHKSNDLWYCDTCAKDAPGIIIEEQRAYKGEIIKHVPHPNWHIYKYKLEQIWKNLVGSQK